VTGTVIFFSNFFFEPEQRRNSPWFWSDQVNNPPRRALRFWLRVAHSDSSACRVPRSPREDFFFKKHTTSTTPSTKLKVMCHHDPCRPYFWQQASHPTFCAHLTLQETSSLRLPLPGFILTFGRPSFADHPRAFFSAGDYSTTFFSMTPTRVDLRETSITTFTFLTDSF